MMNWVFKNYGVVLGSRDIAEKIRNEIESFEGVATLDFQGVRTISHAFADELIGKLAEKLKPSQFKKKIKIINLHESNRAIFEFVVSERLSVIL